MGFPGLQFLLICIIILLISDEHSPMSSRAFLILHHQAIAIQFLSQTHQMGVTFGLRANIRDMGYSCFLQCLDDGHFAAQFL
jgi:hypothetical protein